MGKKSKGRDRERRRDTVARDPSHLATRLDSVAVHLLRHLGREDVPAGATGARLSALSVLVGQGPLTLGSLASVEGVRPPSMTRLVSALEADGLVERVRDPDDGRRVYIQATPAGAELLDSGREQRVTVLAEQLRGYRKRSLRTLEDATSILENMLLGRPG
jgi:DNA-binding MarR family transcriptional regulator